MGHRPAAFLRALLVLCGYWVFFDTDSNPSTGLASAGARAFSIGAEYNLAGVKEFNAWAAGG